MRKSTPAFLIIIFFSACGLQNDGHEDKLFTRLHAEETGIAFFNEVEDQEYFNVFTYRNFYNGGGVAIGDINNDSFADIYFTSNMDKNRLYLNKGNWKFEDVTEKAGVAGTKSWSTGVTMADVNNDGLLDIYVCNSGDLKGDNKENELFINNGDLTFTEKGKQFGLNKKGYSTHASFFDYDLDGDLDCYLLNNSFKNIERVEQYLISREIRDAEGGDKLLRNDGDTFTDVSEEAGIYGGWIGFGLGVSVSDLNKDMLPDIFISNDFWERDYLYINKGDGTFSEELISRTSVISGSSMGSDIADLDNDGDAEVFTTEMLPGDNYRLKTMTRFEETNIKELKVRSSYHYQLMQNCLHINDGQGDFQEMAFISNVAATDWSWGALMFDMDNNGWKDIFISNGIYRDITSMDFANFVADRENIKKIVLEKGSFNFNDLLAQIPSSKVRNYAFVNQKNKTFESLADSLGLGEPSFSNGSAYGDLDNDGDMDLVVNNLNMPSFIYRNNAEKLSNNYLRVKFAGTKENLFGIGAKVTLYVAGKQQVLQNFNTRGFQSSIEPHLLFGLGSTKSIDSLIVIWPDLRKQVLKNISSNQTLILDHSRANLQFKKPRLKENVLFTEVAEDVLQGDYFHRENEFNDFNMERLLPRKVSTEGPKIITGDLNGDQKTDFLLAGAFGDPDKLFFQNANGRFVQSKQEVFQRDSIFESTCGAFFDADNDGDLDILMGSGGNEFRRGVKAHLLRLYENDGNGNFTRGEGPSAAGNFSCILPEDFDRDGDIDVFIGGRIVPGNYGLVPRSFLFRNDNGRWENIAPPTLAGAGMITGATWSDIDNDSKKDLIVVGEWMPVLVFKNTGNSLEEAKAFPGTAGWWTGIEASDLDGDGDEDFVLGNWGLNTKFKASVAMPLTMYVKDFDNNNKSEFIINWYPPLNDKSYPFATKKDLTQQLPMLKKTNLKYEDYAHKTYEDLFTKSQRQGALYYKTELLESIILWNNPGNLTIQPLPFVAQVSPVFGVAVNDFDKNGVQDIWLGGNFYGLKPEVGRHNSSRGVYLKGLGNNKFEYMQPHEIGIYVDGEVRDATLIDVNGKEILMIARNNNSILCFANVTKEPSAITMKTEKK